MSKSFNTKLITYKCKISTKSHDEVLDIMYNLVFHNSFIHIFNVSSSKLLYIDEI